MSLTDAELVSRALNNEMSAFQQLVERYKKRVYFTAYGVVGNHHDAEDVLQETLLSALRSLDRLRHPEGFGPWILRIAFNRSVDYRRKRKREVSPNGDEEGVGLFDRIESNIAKGNPDTYLRSEEINELVNRSLSQLPESQRNAFLLKHVAHLSIREIAHATNSTESTVKTNIYRAVKRLRKELAQMVNREVYVSGNVKPGTCES